MDTSKIIIGTVGGGRYTVTSPIVKEDYGLYLKIEGLELPSTYEVDFSNSEHNGTSVTMIGNADGVLIPSQFISSGKDVFAFLYHVGEDYGRTIFKFRIPNKLRPDRTNEQPTPEEQSTIDQAISALNSAVAQTAQDVIDADASAQSAQGYAESAEEYAESASTSATEALASETTARSYANSASASATASAQSAEQSAINSADAQDSAEESQASASASAQSATASANSASQASGYAQSASASAQSASGYASSAETSAQAASAKASEASASASTASQKASESAQSAINAQTYATQAESAKTASQTAQGVAESARDTAVQAKTDAESARDEAQNIVDGISAKAEQIDQNTADIIELESTKADLSELYKAFPTDTASGAIASFPDGADDIPLKSLIVDINPVQDLSQGDPSPENICPISGWTQVEVNHSDADMTNPTTITIDLGQTVYGGKLDVLSGELTIDRAMVDLATIEWSVYDTTNKRWNTRIQAMKSTTVRSDKLWSDRWRTSKQATTGDEGVIFGYLNYAFFYTSDTNNTPIGQLMYELASPITYQLTPQEITSLLGTNNLWADTGDTEVEYRADTTLYINRLTEPDADMIADSNITSGQYFMVGNSLFKATANIANGAQIVVGTNCTRVSLAQALNEINA